MRGEGHALDAARQVVAVSLEAANDAAARELARSKGLEVFAIQSRLPVFRMKRSARFPTLLFSMELKSLLDAGLNLVEALQTLAEKEGASERQQVLSGIVAALNRGEPFSQAAAGFPEAFPPLYVATIKAAERTGDVPEALARTIEYMEELERVKKKVVSASIYPAILLGVGVLVMGFLLLYVVPRFAQVYEDMAGNLPFFSQLLLAFGGFIGRNASVMVSLFLSVMALAAWAFTRPAFRSWANARLWQLPALGSRMKVYQLSRLYRTAGMLLRAGIPAVRALEMAQDLLSSHLRPQLAQARRLIEHGRPMSAALAAAGLATPVASRMMAVGERAGDMGRMFGEIARFHDGEVARDIDWFTRAFEPALMAALGIAVGLIVVLMYMPIFELAGSIR
jgi:general secretion pathway protein F